VAKPKLALYSRAAGALLFELDGTNEAATGLAHQLEAILLVGLEKRKWNDDGTPNLPVIPDGDAAPERLTTASGKQSDDPGSAPVADGSTSFYEAGADKIQSLLVALRPSVRWILVEMEYFDLDYRSEFSATHVTAFGMRSPDCSRLHLFGETRFQPAPEDSLQAAVQSLSQQYLGYVIVRPQFPGTVGRTLISSQTNSAPPGHDRGPLLSGLRLDERIRTQVRELVEVLGVAMSVVGVPYMEQDGHLLRCSHVSAWIAHYTCVLRGIVPRRPSAAFHLVEDGTGAYGRHYPSSGLTTDVLSRILRKLDLPPEVVDLESLIESRHLRWYDSQELAELVLSSNPDQVRTPLQGEALKQPDLSRNDEERLIRAWTTENLGTTVCRYLNSGLPVILAEDLREHTRVICGYLRRGEYAPESHAATGSDGSPAHNDPNGVSAFILQDDQDDPYTIEAVDEIVEAAASSRDGGSGLTLVVPLPRGLWMSGETAERHGAAVFEHFIPQRLQALTPWCISSEVPGELQVEYEALYSHLYRAIREGSRTQALRTYVASSSAFKIGFSQRVNDTAAAETLGFTRLPKFVWVVELIERSIRNSRKDANYVNGTVVLDASIVEDAKDPEKFGSPLFLHIRGQAAGIGRYRKPSWKRTRLDPYASGRWSPTQANDLDLLAMSWKGASASTS
jgi:hypothetical protein